MRNFRPKKEGGCRSLGDTRIDGIGFARHHHIELDSETRRAFVLDLWTAPVGAVPTDLVSGEMPSMLPRRASGVPSSS